MLYIGFMFAVCYPLIFLWLAFGQTWAIKLSLAIVVVTTTMGVTFLVGAGFMYLFQGDSKFKSYELPKMWLNQYLQGRIGEDGGIAFILLAPYVAYADAVRVFYTFADHSESLFVWGGITWGVYLLYMMAKIMWGPFEEQKN